MKTNHNEPEYNEPVGKWAMTCGGSFCCGNLLGGLQSGQDSQGEGCIGGANDE